MIAVSLERGTFKLAELEAVRGQEEESVTVPKFSVGQMVRVLREDSKVIDKILALLVSFEIIMRLISSSD